MSCTCGTASVGGKCTSWCDSNKIELPTLINPPEDDQGDPFIHFQFNSYPGSPPSHTGFKYYQLKKPTTVRTVEDAVIELLYGMTITEKQMDDLKSKFIYNSYSANGKEVVSFVTQVFEEL